MSISPVRYEKAPKKKRETSIREVESGGPRLHVDVRQILHLEKMRGSEKGNENPGRNGENSKRVTNDLPSRGLDLLTVHETKGNAYPGKVKWESERVGQHPEGGRGVRE